MENSLKTSKKIAWIITSRHPKALNYKAIPMHTQGQEVTSKKNSDMPAVNEISIMIHVVWVVKFLLEKTLQHRMFGQAAEFKPGVVQRGVLKVSLSRNDFFKPTFPPKKPTNEFYFTTMKPQVDLFSFVFWRKLKTPKRHFKIN